MLLQELVRITRDFRSAREFLQEKGILCVNPPCCADCGRTMTEVNQSSPRKTDEFLYRCPSHKGRKRTIRMNSFLENHNISLVDFIRLVYLWGYRTNVASVSLQTGHSPTTVVQWYSYFRDVCSHYLVERPNMIGGAGHIVEIDESVFSHRKYNRGRLIRERWVFGGIDTTTGMGFLRMVDERSAEVLLPILQEYIIPGTEIHSDGWRAYSGIAGIQVDPPYTHRVVNHNENFVDPETRATTNHVERMWCEAKKHFKAMNGTVDNMIPGYLDEFMWRQLRGRNPANAIQNMFEGIAFWYNPE
jgi:hypothetical protein